VDERNRRLLMYYHGLAGKTAQYTRIAESPEGLSFRALPGIVHSNYLRTFHYRDTWYGLSMPGILYRSASGVDEFQPRSRRLFDPNMRHAGLWLRDDTLYVFWSRVGDAPESILVSAVDLSSADWDDWQATGPQEVLRAELPWEGSELEVQSSLRGELGLPANELRDPYVFTDDDGQIVLLYVGSGERAIGLARLQEKQGRIYSALLLDQYPCAARAIDHRLPSLRTLVGEKYAGPFTGLTSYSMGLLSLIRRSAI
jgi:hypothetical protein